MPAPLPNFSFQARKIQSNKNHRSDPEVQSGRKECKTIKNANSQLQISPVSIRNKPCRPNKRTFNVSCVSLGFFCCLKTNRKGGRFGSGRQIARSGQEGTGAPRVTLPPSLPPFHSIRRCFSPVLLENGLIMNAGIRNKKKLRSGFIYATFLRNFNRDL